MVKSQSSCPMCNELRGLRLHLHELALFCKFLNNQTTTSHKEKEPRTVYTKTISDWLMLASYLDEVRVNTFMFQMADAYCEPIADFLNSSSNHYESMSTPLTRFLYVANAVEECYRFVNPLYEQLVVERGETKYKREFSVQASCLLNAYSDRITKPKHYEHVVDNYRKRIQAYVAEFPGHVSINLDEADDLSYGLDLMRNIRNHIVHGVFPIIVDPEYDSDAKGIATKRNLISILKLSSRIAALNIQMLLPLAAGEFDSEQYDQRVWDPDHGAIFEEHCTFSYLRDLHITQPFALNEEDYYYFSSDVLNSK
jgi:hypothetical protein